MFLISIFRKICLLPAFIVFKLRHPSVIWVRRTVQRRSYFSQGGQDAFMALTLFKYLETKDVNNLIIDVGANHPEKFSNSLFFERFLNCHVIAVDPLAEFKTEWENKRPNAEFLALALGSKAGTLDLRIPIGGDNMFSRFNSNSKSENWETRKVSVSTLDKLLEDRSITNALLMFIDVEGFEIDVLRGINLNMINIKAIVLENNVTAFGSEEVRKYLKDQGYVFYARIDWLDDVFIRPEVNACDA